MRCIRPALCAVGLAGLLATLGCPDRRLADARALVEAGRYEEAGDAFVRLAKTDPANLGAWDGAVQLWCRDQVNVGRCMTVLDLELQLLGSLQRHRDALSEVLERRGRARLEKGLVEAALKDFDRAVSAAPERPSVHTARARVFMMRGETNAMLEALDRAKKLAPKHVEADELYQLVPTDASDASTQDGVNDGFGGAVP